MHQDAKMQMAGSGVSLLRTHHGTHLRHAALTASGGRQEGQTDPSSTEVVLNLSEVQCEVFPPAPCPEELCQGHVGYPTPLFGVLAPEQGCQSWLARGIRQGLTPGEAGALRRGALSIHGEQL